MDADLIQQQAIEWLIAADEDWPGVNDCGALFVPDSEMRFDIDDEEWQASNSC